MLIPAELNNKLISSIPRVVQIGVKFGQLTFKLTIRVIK
jgi:hypothetical protein